LLFPIEIALPPQQMSTIAKILPQLSKIGFEVEVKDINRISITAIPPFLRNSDIKNIINGLIDDLAEKINEETPSIISELAASIACHSAIKAGRKLSRDEMLALFEQLFTCEQPFRCPHGRPTIIKFTKSEFEKMFGRHS
ncbi:MAG TPA: DNA mismatch repair protein MutL, partial [candidate division Zixibacteria bacterium]|nr:DNA mismatch repair protein MutL [candidate division Zixibacteria bacterium]